MKHFVCGYPPSNWLPCCATLHVASGGGGFKWQLPIPWPISPVNTCLCQPA